MDMTLRNCKDYPTELFYPDSSDHASQKLAMAVCAECPLRAECLQLAIDNNETEGIWGGTPGSERKYMIRYKVSVEKYLSIKCGTEAAYYRHRRLMEKTCQDCKDAFKSWHGKKSVAGRYR